MSIKRYSNVRLDKGELTSQGFLKAPAFLTRVGVFKYKKKDGTIVRELRHPDDVFDEDSLASLEMAPLTDDHPKEFITSENIKQYQIGWVSEKLANDEDKIGATVVVSDKTAIQKANTGKVELSCGYTADLIDEAGEYKGEKYDLRQKNIRYNHVALVNKGRAGAQVRLRLDSEDAQEILDQDLENEVDNESDTKGVSEMVKVKIGDREFEVAKDLAEAIDSLKAVQQDSAKALADAEAAKVAKEEKEVELLASKEKIDGVTAEKDALQARVDALTEQVNQKKDGLSNEEIQTAVRERIKLEKTAAIVLGEAKFEDKADLDLIKEVITKHSPKAELANKSDVYLRARFDAISEELEGTENRRAELGKKITAPKTDAVDADAARIASNKADLELWKQPLSANRK